MIPSLGRIVIYNTTEDDRKKMENMNKQAPNSCNVQKQLPAIIVAVWNNDQPATEKTLVNLKVNLDGNAEGWVTSVHQGHAEGQWHEPKRV